MGKAEKVVPSLAFYWFVLASFVNFTLRGWSAAPHRGWWKTLKELIADTSSGGIDRPCVQWGFDIEVDMDVAR